MLRAIAKKAVRKMLGLFGVYISRTERPGRSTSMESAFRMIQKRGHVIQTVVDVGASDGRWTRSFQKYYPRSNYLLIEAQAVHKASLENFCRENNSVQFVLAAAGEKKGVLYFDASDPFSGQASYTPYTANNIEVPVVAIQDEVHARGLRGPYLLKLDTHGFEVPIVKGALRILPETEVIVMECYNFKISPESLIFDEMCGYLRGLGFRCIHLVDPGFRPFDGSLWQMDLVFVKDNRPEFQHLAYL